MLVIQIISLIGSLLFLLLVFLAIYRSKLREGYALLWIAVTAGMIVLSLAPRLLNKMARLVGIQTPAFLLMLFMLVGIVLVLFQQSIVISKHNETIRRLLEELTLLKAGERERNNDKK